jgi:hypothetical protein
MVPPASTSVRLIVLAEFSRTPVNEPAASDLASIELLHCCRRRPTSHRYMPRRTGDRSRTARLYGEDPRVGPDGEGPIVEERHSTGGVL